MQGGSFIFSNAFPVYAANGITQNFTLAQAATTLSIQWYGRVKGSPASPIQGVLKLMPLGTIMGTAAVPASSIGTKDQWDAPFVFTGAFSAGQYQLVLSTSGGDAANNYQVWLISDVISDGQAIYNAGVNSSSGNSVVWVKDASGNTLALYPFEMLSLTFPNPQSFVAPTSFSAHGIVVFIGDRHWDTTQGNITISDASTGAVLSTGVLDQNLTAGMQGMVPVQIDPVVNFIAGKTYSIKKNEVGITWGIPIRGTYFDPIPAGFNANTVLEFKLPSSQFVPMFSDLNSITTTGADAVASNSSVSILFSPSVSATLTEFHVLMKGFGALGNYAAGDILSASVYANAPMAVAPYNQPSGNPLQTVSLPSGSVPKFGFADFTGFNLPVTAPMKYQVVLSLNPTSTQKMTQARFVTPYKFEVLRSYPGSNPLFNYMAEGPTDLSFRVVTTAEQIGNFITDIPAILASGAIAQPFIPLENMNVNGVAMGTGFKLDGKWDSFVTVSINPDNAGVSSLTKLGSGKFRVAEQTWEGSQYVGFDTAAPITAGTKYHLVMTPNAGMTVMGTFAIIYYIQPSNWPSGLNAMKSNNGTTWSQIVGAGTSYPTSVAAIVPFWLADQSGASMQMTTRMSLVAKQV